jgi:hypothetical protein
MMVSVRFAYFGYSACFATSAATTAERRAEANGRVIAKFGPDPAIAYVALGVPFPDYVPCCVWDEEEGDFA